MSGIWELAVATDLAQSAYKYHIVNGGYSVDKADPFGFHHETPPHTASKVWSLDYDWQDGAGCVNAGTMTPIVSRSVCTRYISARGRRNENGHLSSPTAN